MDRELKLLLSGVRVFLIVFGLVVVLVIALLSRLPHGPLRYGDGACTVTGGVGQCVMP